jgi:hypothetical protein
VRKRLSHSGKAFDKGLPLTVFVANIASVSTATSASRSRPAPATYPTGRIALFMIPQSTDGPDRGRSSMPNDREPKSNSRTISAHTT